MYNPMISIVVCCHNRADLLPLSLDSILSQNYRNVEIIVLDDGSTDGTETAIQKYMRYIHYQWQPNQGVARARTNACKLAKGEFIAFQDDDDLMPPNRIPVLMDALNRYPNAVFSFGDWAIIDPQGQETGERSNFKLSHDGKNPLFIEEGYREILWTNAVPVPHTTLFRKKDGLRLGWFDTRFYHSHEDTDFFARLATLGPIVYVPRVVSLHRRQHNSLCTNTPALLHNRLLLYEKHISATKKTNVILNRRLCHNLFITFRDLILYLHQHPNEKSPVSSTYFLRKSGIIGLRNLLEFIFLKYVKLPVRKHILKIPPGKNYMAHFIKKSR